jgi:hypothetical protein
MFELTVCTCYKDGVMASRRERWRSSRRRRLVLDEGEMVGRDPAGRSRDWARWRWRGSTLRRRGVRRDETAGVARRSRRRGVRRGVTALCWRTRNTLHKTSHVDGTKSLLSHYGDNHKYINKGRHNHPHSASIRNGLAHQPKRPAIYFKLQGRMFLITAEGINVLRAAQILFKVHRRSKCWCTMG